MNDYDNRYSVKVDILTFQLFEKNRTRLGISASEYLKQLMNLDYSGEIILEKPDGKMIKKHVDLNQTRLYRKE